MMKNTLLGFLGEAKFTKKKKLNLFHSEQEVEPNKKALSKKGT